MSKALSTGNKETGGWVVRNAATILMLPPPPHEWAWNDLPGRMDTPDPFPEGLLDIRNTLRTHGIITKAGKETVNHPNGSTSVRSLWTVKSRVWRLAADEHKRRIKLDMTLPCGHRAGFHTVDADEGVYECGHDFCTARYDRETIEEADF